VRCKTVAGPVLKPCVEYYRGPAQEGRKEGGEEKKPGNKQDTTGNLTQRRRAVGVEMQRSLQGSCKCCPNGRVHDVALDLHAMI
jgi:hypothetical protein